MRWPTSFTMVVSSVGLELMACSGEGGPAGAGPPSTAEVSAPDPRTEWETSEFWQQQAAGEELAFGTGSVVLGELEPDSKLSHADVSAGELEGGRLLVDATMVISEGYDYRTLYLTLAPEPEGWRIESVGYWVSMCTFIGWVEPLSGLITLDATSEPGVLLFRVALTTGRWRDDLLGTFECTPDDRDPSLVDGVAAWIREIEERARGE